MLCRLTLSALRQPSDDIDWGLGLTLQDVWVWPGAFLHAALLFMLFLGIYFVSFVGPCLMRAGLTSFVRNLPVSQGCVTITRPFIYLHVFPSRVINLLLLSSLKNDVSKDQGQSLSSIHHLVSRSFQALFTVNRPGFIMPVISRLVSIPLRISEIAFGAVSTTYLLLCPTYKASLDKYIGIY